MHSTERMKHKCPECGKEFQHSALMKEHIIQCHTDSRPYTCNTCGGSFATKRYLRNHHRKVHKRKIHVDIVTKNSDSNSDLLHKTRTSCTRNDYSTK